jgi:hypothetical protein
MEIKYKYSMEDNNVTEFVRERIGIMKERVILSQSAELKYGIDGSFMRRASIHERPAEFATDDFMSFDEMEIYWEIKNEALMESRKIGATVDRFIKEKGVFPKWVKIEGKEGKIYPYSELYSSYYKCNFLSEGILSEEQVRYYALSPQEIIVLAKILINRNEEAYQRFMSKDIEAILDTLEIAAVGGMVRHVHISTVAAMFPSLRRKLEERPQLNVMDPIESLKSTILVKDEFEEFCEHDECKCHECEAGKEYVVEVEATQNNTMYPYEVSYSRVMERDFEEVRVIQFAMPKYELEFEDAEAEMLTQDKQGNIIERHSPELLLVIGSYLGRVNARVLSQVSKLFYNSMKNVSAHVFKIRDYKKHVYFEDYRDVVDMLRQRGYVFEESVVVEVLHIVIENMRSSHTILHHLFSCWPRNRNCAGALVIMAIYQFFKYGDGIAKNRGLVRLMAMYRYMKRKTVKDILIIINARYKLNMNKYIETYEVQRDVGVIFYYEQLKGDFFFNHVHFRTNRMHEVLKKPYFL